MTCFQSHRGDSEINIIELSVTSQGRWWSEDGPETYTSLIAVVRSRGRDLPTFSLKPRPARKRATGSLMGKKRRRSAFDRNYRLETRPLSGASALMTNELRDFLGEESIWRIEGIGEWILACKTRGAKRIAERKRPEELQKLIDSALKISNFFVDGE